MLSHDLDFAYLMTLLAIDRAEADDMLNLGRLWAPLGIVRYVRLRLFVNIVLRFEHRLSGDSAAIREALATPLASLDGRSPASLFGGTLDDLARIRRAIEADG